MEKFSNISLCRHAYLNGCHLPPSYKSLSNTGSEFYLHLMIVTMFKLINYIITSIHFNSDTDWMPLKDWTKFETSVESVSWKNFHHNHNDFIKASVRARNGALNDVVLETDGVLIDLTPPIKDYLNDGSLAGSDIDYQVK